MIRQDLGLRPGVADVGVGVLNQVDSKMVKW